MFLFFTFIQSRVSGEPKGLNAPDANIVKLPEVKRWPNIVSSVICSLNLIYIRWLS